MIKEIPECEELDKAATLGELILFLNELIEFNPELASKPVAVASECGYAGAYIASPLTAAVLKDEVKLISDDDGLLNYPYTFYRKEDDNEETKN